MGGFVGGVKSGVKDPAYNQPPKTWYIWSNIVRIYKSVPVITCLMGGFAGSQGFLLFGDGRNTINADIMVFSEMVNTVCNSYLCRNPVEYDEIKITLCFFLFCLKICSIHECPNVILFYHIHVSFHQYVYVLFLFFLQYFKRVLLFLQQRPMSQIGLSSNYSIIS